MPNWCYNRITVYADEDTADKLEELEGVIDKYYDKIEKAKCKQPTPDWED